MGTSTHSFDVGSEFDAQIARDYLADNGIDCVINTNDVQGYPGTSTGCTSWGTLLVKVEDAAKTRELLALIPRGV